jgi:hypothetical protein
LPEGFAATVRIGLVVPSARVEHRRYRYSWVCFGINSFRFGLLSVSVVLAYGLYLFSGSYASDRGRNQSDVCI